MSSFVYMLDPRLEYSLSRRNVNCTLGDAALIRNIHWRIKRRELENRWSDYELPILVKGRKYADAVERIRLVYNCWRDHIEYPRFSKRLLDQDLQIGHSVHMEVLVHGSPALEVKWYKNGLPLMENSNCHVQHYNGDSYVLTIHEALPSDRGLYSCIASNIAGTVRTSCYVNVTKHRTAYARPLGARRFYEKLYDL